jgi:hypothetical protein
MTNKKNGLHPEHNQKVKKGDLTVTIHSFTFLIYVLDEV